MRETTNEDLAHRHAYHRPTNPTIEELHENVRHVTCVAASNLNELLPECQEKQEALKAQRLAMFWANAAIACNARAITPDDPELQQ